MRMENLVRSGGLWMLILMLTGCASMPGADPRDPWEPMNRKIYQFNDQVDRMVLRPVASAYNRITPRPVRAGVSNFFNNASDYWSLINNVAQLKVPQTVEMTMRVSVNTVMGLGGVLDIASEVGLERHKEDLGETLGRYGMPTGPYLVLPLLGPSTVRDAATLVADSQGNPVNHIHPIHTRNQLTALNLVDTRASFLRAGQMLQEAALDEYSFTRDAYLQKRLNDTFDGHPPEDPDPDADVSTSPSAGAPDGSPVAAGAAPAAPVPAASAPAQ